MPGFLIILPSFLLQVPLAHDIFGLIGPNAGLGISISKKYPWRLEDPECRLGVISEGVYGRAGGIGEQLVGVLRDRLMTPGGNGCR